MALVSAWRRVTVYVVEDQDGARYWRWTVRPLVDAAYWRRQGARFMVPLQPPMPAMWAAWACRTAQRMQRDAHNHEHPLTSTRGTSLWRRLWHTVRRNDVVTRLDGHLRLAGYEVGVRAGETVMLDVPEENAEHSGLDAALSMTSEGPLVAAPVPGETDLVAVMAVMRGRRLSIREIERIVEREHVGPERPAADCLAWLAVSNRILQLPGVTRGPFGTLTCTRCGEADALQAWDCAVCGERECWQCEACRSMGAVRSCTVLYAAAAVDGAAGQGRAVPSPVNVQAPELTAAQQRVSDALAAFVRRDAPEPRDALVWAVCGAGKTEMSFAAVGTVLSEGGRVLFAIPRRDVVRELGRRLRTAFPDVELQILHGGADRTVLSVLAPGSLTVATTHQVMRFYRAFDLVILDEVDAFPYRGSRMLAEAVVRATASGGRRIRMTATPDNDLLRQAAAGDSVLVRVPARYHGCPLPVPELVVDKSLDHADGRDDAARRPFKPSRLLMTLIERSLNAEEPVRVLLFVPTVALAERVGRGLAGLMPGEVLWSHARDNERDAKLAAFLGGEARVFVATSILERGVTVPDVDVIVLYSDAERVFQEPALIQMAGRVGRTPARPTGRVAFVGRRITDAMRTAVAHIESMNEDATALGLLRMASADPGGEPVGATAEKVSGS